MPLSLLITIYTPDGKLLPGPIAIADHDFTYLTCSYGKEFEHCICTIQKNYFHTLRYAVYFFLKHEPKIIVNLLDITRRTIKHNVLK